MHSQKKIYILYGVVLLATAIFSKGYYHFDEHFQILEFASLKLGMASEQDMPWEYFFKMRSAIQPAIVVCVYKLVGLFTTPDPFLLVTFTRVMSAFLSFFTALLLIKTFQPEIKSPKLKEAFVPLSLFLWFIIYNSVRFSSENWSGNIFAIALCLSFRSDAKRAVHFFCIGLLLGLAFLFRYQAGFLIAGLVFWQLFIRKENLLHLTILMLAVLVLISAGVLVDRWFYGEWTSTIWNYFDQNILQNKSANFGVEAWWYYFQQIFLNAIPPFSIIYIVGVVFFFSLHPKHVITFCLLPFLLIHFAIGHKEMRFLFPIIYYIPFVIIMVLDRFSTDQIANTWHRVFRFFLWAFGISNVLLLVVVMFRPADSLIPLYEKIYYNYKSPTVLYYNDRNPYERVLNIHFYKRTNLEVAQAFSLAEVKPQQNEKILFATTHPEQFSETSKWQLVYSDLPQWIKRFNFNHWQERTHLWHVYELKCN